MRVNCTVSRSSHRPDSEQKPPSCPRLPGIAHLVHSSIRASHHPCPSSGAPRHHPQRSTAHLLWPQIPQALPAGFLLYLYPRSGRYLHICHLVCKTGLDSHQKVSCFPGLKRWAWLAGGTFPGLASTQGRLAPNPPILNSPGSAEGNFICPLLRFSP